MEALGPYHSRCVNSTPKLTQTVLIKETPCNNNNDNNLDHFFFRKAGTDDETLRQFLLYAQARPCRNRQWSIRPVYRVDYHWRIKHIQLDFEGSTGCWAIIQHLIPCTADDRPVGSGVFHLDLPGVTAFCCTMKETLAAINSIVPFVPSIMDRLAFERHLWKTLHRSEFIGDHVHAAAVRRKMDMMRMSVM